MEIKSNLVVAPAETGEFHTIEELWNMMSEFDKANYSNNIKIYKHHKLAQALREQ